MLSKIILFSCSLIISILFSIIIINPVFTESDYPRTIIKDTKVYSQFYDSNGNYYEWITPISTYENLVMRSNVMSFLGEKSEGYIDQDSLWSKLKDKVKSKLSNFIGIKTVVIDLNGVSYRYQDYTQYSNQAFTNVIDDVYHNSDNNGEFIWNVWFIVSQMTVYDKDVNAQSEGRYPLETLVRTGGDCEDLSILIADMLRSSKYTKNWDIQLVYLDADNPTNPQQLNHVIVYVDDGKHNYFIEATASKPSWNHYPNGVSGWFYDV